MTQFDNASVVKKANVYFEGMCISHSIQFPDGSRKSIGVILPSSLTFKTGVPEVMETVSGRCRVRLPGADDWVEFGEGQSFSVPADSSFDIEVADGEQYHYVCHFG